MHIMDIVDTIAIIAIHNPIDLLKKHGNQLMLSLKCGSMNYVNYTEYFATSPI